MGKRVLQINAPYCNCDVYDEIEFNGLSIPTKGLVGTDLIVRDGKAVLMVEYSNDLPLPDFKSVPERQKEISKKNRGTPTTILPIKEKAKLILFAIVSGLLFVGILVSTRL